MFGRLYKPLNGCADWCKKVKLREVALCVICDRRNEYVEAFNEKGKLLTKEEEGENEEKN